MTSEASGDEQIIPNCRSTHYAPVRNNYPVRKNSPVPRPYQAEVYITLPIDYFLPN